MRIRAIRLRNVKKIGEAGLAIDAIADDLNVLSEPNEFGKSTIFEALSHGLLSKHSSKSKEIEALRPHISGAAPEVEIDLEWQGDDYRIFKRFLSKAEASITRLDSGRIIHRADDAQDWIKNILGAEGKGGGATGLLWVTQGDSLKMPSQSGEDQEVFSGVLDNEVSTLISGRKGRSVYAKVEAELKSMLSLKTFKPAAAYKVVLNDQADLEEDCTKLSADLLAAEQDITRLTDVERQLRKAQDSGDSTDLQDQLGRYKSDRETALTAISQHKTLQSGHALAQSELTLSETRLSDLVETMKEATELDRSIAENSDKLKTVATAIKDDETKQGQATATLKTAREAVAAARVEKNSAQLTEYNTENQSRLKELSADLEKAKSIQLELTSLSAKIGKIKVDNPALTTLTAAESQLSTAKALLKSSQVTAKITYLAKTKEHFKAAGDVLKDGAVLPVKGQLTLEMDGIARVEITNPLSAEGETENKLSAAQATFDDLCRDFGVSSMAEAKTLEKQRFELKQQREDRERELIRFAPDGVQKLEEDIAALTAKLSDVAKAGKTLAEAEDYLQKCLLSESQSVSELAVIETALQSRITSRARIETSLEQQTEARQGLTVELGPADQIDSKRKSAISAQATRQEALVKAAVELETFEKSMPNMETIDAGITRITKAIQNRSQARQNLEKDQIEIKARLGLRFEDGIEEALAVKRGELAAVTVRAQAFQSESDALKLLNETLLACQSSEKQKLFEPVIREIGPLARQVIPGIEFEFGEDFAASDIIRNGVTETIESLSGGTQEQIAILTRLVFARLKAKQGFPTPVILDDALVFSDDDRIAEMFNALNTVAKDVQIIVLTCRQKSFEGLGGNLLSTGTWGV